MRICRFQRSDKIELGFYHDEAIVAIQDAVDVHNHGTHQSISLPHEDILALLPHGSHAQEAESLAKWIAEAGDSLAQLELDPASVTLLNPLPPNPKIFLLAGNYALHIQESGEIAVERQETFPYLFSKPRTALNHPNGEIVIPKVSPDFIDYECELGVIIGKKAKGVSEAEALGYVAGYTVVNDISDRKYRPNPERKERPKDTFFDWMHGKWHDGFFPVGPAVASAKAIPDPQVLDLRLTVDGEERQHSSTGRMIFPVAAVIEFVSRLVTLEPGDIIATGTCEGIGLSSGKLLKPGQVVEATIEKIGTLKNTMVAE
ncbi:MAG: fumarylacetoacetate hydrolase family protein [Candidatus Hydrogenedentes bacterium]|nr:fumarylacetoacetate hydrolase family protein [Candidatus Hydrogenedentota bacterium]